VAAAAAMAAATAVVAAAAVAAARAMVVAVMAAAVLREVAVPLDWDLSGIRRPCHKEGIRRPSTNGR